MMHMPYMHTICRHGRNIDSTCHGGCVHNSATDDRNNTSTSDTVAADDTATHTVRRVHDTIDRYQHNAESEVGSAHKYHLYAQRSPVW
jgi:hypothetical protein